MGVTLLHKLLFLWPGGGGFSLYLLLSWAFSPGRLISENKLKSPKPNIHSLKHGIYPTSRTTTPTIQVETPFSISEHFFSFSVVDGTHGRCI